MFPISGSIAKTAGYIKGNCNATPKVEVPSVTVGLLNDVDTLEWKRRSEKYSKIFAIVPRDYFDFHDILDEEGNPATGAIIGPKWKSWKSFLWWKWLDGFLGGSWNVAFVADDQKHQGTVAHELAHTLGQGREFYDSHEMCRQFIGSPEKLCREYQIPTVLDIFYEQGKQTWNFKRDMFSIVNNRGKITTQWIDRETYQKTFLILSKVGAVAPADVDIFSESNRLGSVQKPAYNLILSGFYNPKEDRFIAPKIRIRKKVSFMFEPPKLKNNKGSTVSIQLKEGENLIKEIKHPVLEMEKKVFYKGGAVKTFPFPFSHIMAGFYLPKDYKKKDLRMIVLNSEGKKIKSFSVPKKDTNKKSQSVVFFDKEDKKRIK